MGLIVLYNYQPTRMYSQLYICIELPSISRASTYLQADFSLNLNSTLIHTMNDHITYTESSHDSRATEQSSLIYRDAISSESPARTKLKFYLRLAVIFMMLICTILELLSNENNPLLLAHTFYSIITLLWTVFVVMISGPRRLFWSKLWQDESGSKKPFRRMVPLVDAYQSAYLCMVSIWIASWPNIPENLLHKRIYVAVFVLHFAAA